MKATANPMATKPLPQPLAVRVGNRATRLVTVEDAMLALSSVDWPVRGPRHRDALETGLKIMDGHRSVDEAVGVIRAAEDEALGR